MSSKAFEEFQREYFQDRGPFDGIPTHLLLKLEGDERVEAENQLLANLESRDSSYRAIIGLGLMRCKRAGEPLKKMFGQPVNKNPYLYGSSYKTDIALALWRIERFPQAFDEFVRVLNARPTGNEHEIAEGDSTLEDGGLVSRSDQIDAVFGLKQIRTVESVKELIKALDHPNDSVRYHATKALATMCGPYPVIAGASTAMMSKDQKEREKIKRAILKLINPESPPAPLADDFEIYFDMHGYEFLHYFEFAGARNFTFHIRFAEHGVLIHIGDYLTDVLGDPREFSNEEIERIVPRLHAFFENQRIVAHFLDTKHEPEPNMWRHRSVRVRMLPRKDDVQRMTATRDAVLNNYLERIEANKVGKKKTTWSNLILVGVIGGAIGATIGTFIYLLGDSSFLIPSICALLLGVFVFWFRRQ